MFQLHITKKIWHLHLLIKQSRCLKAFGFSVLWLFSAFKTNWWKKNKENSERNDWSEVSSFHLIMRSSSNYWRIKWHLWAKFIEKLQKNHKLHLAVYLNFFWLNVARKFHSQGLTLRVPKITECVIFCEWR